MAVGSALVWDESFKANADLSTKQFFAVKITAADTVGLTTAATDRCVGILQNKPAASGRAAEVRLQGKTKAVSDGSGTAIAAGDLVGPDANGRLVKKATNDYTVIGTANTASNAVGTVIEVLLGVGFATFRTAAG